jgi:hypothetical protein
MCSVIAVAMGVKAIGNIQQGIAAKQRGQAAKAAAYRSADAAERAAADAVQRGSLKDLQYTMQGSKVVAAQRVIQSGSGVDVNIGTTKAVQDATQAVSDVDRAVVRRNAALEAYGLRERARGLRQEGMYAEAEGDNAMVGTFLSGIGEMVGEGGKRVVDIA